MTLLLDMLFIMLFVMGAIIIYIKLQLFSVGLTIGEFLDFVKANEILDNLDRKTQIVKRLNYNEKLSFLMESERVFEVFDKTPNVLWEDLYPKYMNVLETYKEIKMIRWAEANN